MTTSSVPLGYWILCAAFALFFSRGQTLRAAERTTGSPPLSAEKKKLGAFLFSKIKASRKKLRSGVFEATESTVTIHPKLGKHESAATAVRRGASNAAGAEHVVTHRFPYL